MKKIFMSMVYVLLVFVSACAQKEEDMKNKSSSPPKITRELLLKQGFKESPNRPGVFERNHVNLKEILDELGITFESLHPMINQSPIRDERTGNIQDVEIVVREEVQFKQGSLITSLPDGKDVLYTVYVYLNRPKIPPKHFLETDSSPQLHIESVTRPKDDLMALQIEFKITADGKKPVAILRKHFYVYLTKEVPSLGYGIYVQFPDKTPDVILVTPGKPTVLSVNIPHTSLSKGSLSFGDYGLQIGIGADKIHDQTEDYEWQGDGYKSNKYTITLGIKSQKDVAPKNEKPK